MKWYFTFMGSDEVHRNCVQPIIANSYMEARYAMFEKYGDNWAFQYSEDQWNDWNITRPVGFPIERELDVIDCTKGESESGTN